MAQITLNSSGVASSGSLLLQTNGTTTQATVDTSGNLGLGVTPSAWASAYKAVQIGSQGSFSAAGNLAVLSSNWYSDSSFVNKYITSNYATRYTQYNGTHYWDIAASGTAGNTITFTQAMTLDASGNLVLGDTGAPYSSKIARVDNSNSAVQSFFARNTNTGSSASCGYFFNSSGNSWAIEMGSSAKNSNALTFSVDVVGTPTERMRLDTSGNLLVGTTSSAANINSNCVVIRNPSGGSTTFGTSSTSATLIDFQVQGGIKGSISSTTSTTTYATSSDYRLKENIAPMTGALAKVAALKPVTYKWKVDGSDGEGFIAHELAQVCPHAVTGVKDAVDEGGNPVYQGIDTSFLVATLTAALQEMKAIVDAQAARITALEQA